MLMKQLSDDLLASIGNSNVISLTGDVIDTLISNSAESKTLKSIPVIGTCLALYKDTKNIQVLLLAKKLYVMLTQLSDLNASQIYDLVYEIDYGGSKVQQQIGEILIGIIDKSDNIVSTTYIAQLFRCYILKKISLDDFLEGSRILNNMSINTIFMFLSVSDWSQIDDMDCRDYFRAGLVDKLDIDEVRQYDENQTGTYKVGKLYNRLSRIGKVIRDCLSCSTVDWENCRLLQIKNDDLPTLPEKCSRVSCFFKRISSLLKKCTFK